MLEGAAGQEAQLPYSDLSSESASEYGEDEATHAGSLAISAPTPPAPMGRDGSGHASVVATASLETGCSAADAQPSNVGALAAAADATASPAGQEKGTS